MTKNSKKHDDAFRALFDNTFASHFDATDKTLKNKMKDGEFAVLFLQKLVFGYSLTS